MSKPNALIISFSEIHKDPRVIKQIDLLLSENYEVSVCGFSKPQKNVRFFYIDDTEKKSLLGKIRAATLLKLKFYSQYYWEKKTVKQALRALENHSFDLIIANDALTLPLVLNIKNNATAICDLHEYAPEEFSDLFSWRFFFKEFNYWLCENFLAKFDGVVTVCDPIAKKYASEFKIETPIVIENRPPYFDLKPQQVGSQVKMIHHGLALPSRKIELMIEMAGILKKTHTLDLILVSSNKAYFDHLKALASQHHNIRFLPPVETKEIAPFCNCYDIGLFLLPPTNFNYLNALPNKFFEFIQSRLAVAIGPSPAMTDYVLKYKNGIIADDFSASNLAQKIAALTPNDIMQFKEASALAAKELSFENSMTQFKKYISKCRSK